MSKTITIDFRDGRTSVTLQRAVDEVAAGGGVVEVPQGVYLMQDALHLRSGVRVVGEPGAVLLKAPSVTSPLLDYIGYGHYEFSVSDPDRFRVGMGVHICDDRSGGFYDTVATIIARQGDLFYIDRMLNHDYHPANNGRVTSLFPIIEGFQIADAEVEGLTLDGNPEEARTLNGCRGGGVFLLLSQNVRLQGIEVRHFKGDAISFQQCADITIRGCHLHDNTGAGLHPGSGSVRYVMEENNVHDNGGCGVFYCLRTTHSICASNRLQRNGAAGISVGERDTDHLICHNTIVDNHRQGILFRPAQVHGGDRVRIEANTIGPNCRGDAEYEIDIQSGLHDIAIVDNAIQPGKVGTLSVGAGCERICFTGNRIAGQEQQPADIGGDTTPVQLESPADFPPVGPAALPLDGAMHLNIATLPPKEWR